MPAARTPRIRRSLDEMPDAMSVPEAGEVLGLRPTAAYAMAARGELPVIRRHGRMVVGKGMLRKLLAGEWTPPTSETQEPIRGQRAA